MRCVRGARLLFHYQALLYWLKLKRKVSAHFCSFLYCLAILPFCRASASRLRGGGQHQAAVFILRIDINIEILARNSVLVLVLRSEESGLERREGDIFLFHMPVCRSIFTKQ